ncbi:MAG: peptidylprolyl isomerase [Chitinophagales bacterium]
MKNVVLIVFLLCCSQTFFGQAIAWYGNHQISRDEFLSAYRKNNTNAKATDQSYREYLNLYIRYRLKVQAAYDKKMDTLPAQLSELHNFRSQIADQYSNDETSLNRMVEEAFVRSHKDLRLSYIFVAAPKTAAPGDTLKAHKKIMEAHDQLKKMKDFGEVALTYSEDPFVKSNRGDLGYITVFDLPYTMETIAYRIRDSQVSPVFRTDGGYFIIKKTGERPAAGRMRAAQILLIFPYQANDVEKEDTRQRADSLYRAILSGSDFGELARKFSGDNLSYQMGGVLPEFGIGKYDPVFEQVAYGLQKDGDISKPFASSFGYHILKRISRIPVSETRDKKTMDELRNRVKADKRIGVSRKEMLQSVLKKTGFKQMMPAGNHLFVYTDSMLLYKKDPGFHDLNAHSVLFRFPDKTYTVGDWVSYRRTLGGVPALLNGKTNLDLLDQYKQTVAFEYFKAHLERYNKDFANQLNEFRDGNLLFEIMQKQVWDKASADTAGLKNFFETHARSYWWKSSADAIIFNAGALASAEKIRQEIQNGTGSWRIQVESLGGKVQADSGRFEIKQLPDNGNADDNGFTSNMTNSDKTVQFAYIIRKHTDPSPRSLSEARGLVINDYQNELENNWIGELKKKYPVKISQDVLGKLEK